MGKYGLNLFLTALVSFLIAVISFLVGNEWEVPSIPTAATGGFLGGVAIALSYAFGKLMGGDTFDSKEFVIMLLSGSIFGILGGLAMGL